MVVAEGGMRDLENSVMMGHMLVFANSVETEVLANTVVLVLGLMDFGMEVNMWVLWKDYFVLELANMLVKNFGMVVVVEDKWDLEAFETVE